VTAADEGIAPSGDSAPGTYPPAGSQPLVVVDASVFGALVFSESRSREAADLLAEATLISPGLVRYEMANIGRTKIMRNPESGALITRAFRRWLELPVRLVTPDFGGVLSLAVAEQLSAYDAAYVYVAAALGAPLLTFDEQLGATWRRISG